MSLVERSNTDDRSPLAEVDRAVASLLDATRGDDQATIRDRAVRLCCRLLSSQNIPHVTWSSDLIGLALSNDLPVATRQIITATLLRLLSHSPNLFDRGAPFATAFAMFEEVVADDVRRAAEISDRDPDFRKRQKWALLAAQAEGEWKAVISSAASVNSPESLRTLRQAFMRILNQKITKAIVSPFLPAHLTTVPLADVFAAVESYLTSFGSNVVAAYREAQNTLKYFQDEAETWGTVYSSDYIAGIAAALGARLEQHFQSCPASQPAQLVIVEPEKKYPLRADARPFGFAFIVKNLGPGHALDVRAQVTDAIYLHIGQPELYLGSLDVDPAEVLVQFEAQVDDNAGGELSVTYAQVEVTWVNMDETPGTISTMLELRAQRGDIDWDDLADRDPYSLEPVTSESDFVGRTETIQSLMRSTRGEHIGSAYVWGQKRVGKTSIVKILARRLQSQIPDHKVVYLDAGDYINQDPSVTIAYLGTRICKAIAASDERLRHLAIPNFERTLAPLNEFADNVTLAVPEFKALIILDEFDELPPDLYKPGEIAKSLFVPLRSNSSKSSFGFILVGGEKMEFVRSHQGVQLNKFKSIEIDYFDRERHWADFQDLVRRPVKDSLEISDNALNALYAHTAGNPFFTKLICAEVFQFAVARRDSHVTEKEVWEAVQVARTSTGSQSFQHFWKDGTPETGERYDTLIMNRQKVLLALAQILRHQESPTKSTLCERAKTYGLPEHATERILADFERRRIMEVDGETYKCRVPFFEGWLVEFGVREIMTSFEEADATLARETAEAEAYVRSEEVRKLASAWGTYKQRSITEDNVREWLVQFGDNHDQRAMFELLRGIKFCTGHYIRTKLQEANALLGRHGVVRRIEVGRNKTRDILVSYLEDSPAKSGTFYAQKYADENDIYKDNVRERSQLARALDTMANLSALVFIDDFIGTGESASKSLSRLDKEIGDRLRDANLPIFLFAVCGFVDGKDKVERTVEELGLNVTVHLCDPLDDTAKCFHERSAVLPDPIHRARAHDLALQYGARLQKDHPLGFGDSQALVVFEQSCPNNTLPILWSEPKDGSWIPLFKR